MSETRTETFCRYCLLRQADQRFDLRPICSPCRDHLVIMSYARPDYANGLVFRARANGAARGDVL